MPLIPSSACVQDTDCIVCFGVGTHCLLMLHDVTGEGSIPLLGQFNAVYCLIDICVRVTTDHDPAAHATCALAQYCSTKSLASSSARMQHSWEARISCGAGALKLSSSIRKNAKTCCRSSLGRNRRCGSSFHASWMLRGIENILRLHD